MNDAAKTMTLTGPDGTSVGPFSLDDLTAASAQVVEPMTAEVCNWVITNRKCSTSLIQRTFAIGYNRAARIVEALEALGVVTSPDHVGKREVVATEMPRSLELSATAQKLVKAPMKETPEDVAVRETAYNVAADELRQFIEQFESLEAEKKDIAEQQKDVMAEAKARGYDTKVIRKIVALRKRDNDDVAEEEAILDLYKSALGMN
jgi:Uncharacterized protein conserved in bacteria